MDNERIDQIIDKHNCEPSSLIQVLLEIQSENHWLPRAALERVSEKLGVPLTRILHIATFYKAFSLTAKVYYEDDTSEPAETMILAAYHITKDKPKDEDKTLKIVSYKSDAVTLEITMTGAFAVAQRKFHVYCA